MDQPTGLAIRRAAPANEISAPTDLGVVRMLAMVRARLLSGDVIAGMQQLIDGLREIRAQSAADEWLDLVSETILRHDVSELLLQCPLTLRSSAKPRGYAGDAELLDHIYGLGAARAAPHPATLQGRIYFYTINSPACRAVRRRREILAAEIDRCAERTTPRKPGIVSIACGHLREADLSAALHSRAIRRFVALDQDEQSLAETSASYARFGVEAKMGTVRGIIAKKIAFEDMDLVYAAGLFDYLAAPIAMRLVERMFGFLRPGGRLLIANFTPAVPDVGYMETFMDWRLILRKQTEVRALFDGLPRAECHPVASFEDEAGVIAYAAVEKRG